MNFENFINSRMEEIFTGLLQNNAEFALAYRRYAELCELVDPVIYRKKDILISAEECESFIECTEQGIELNAIQQRECYKQGFLNCAALLKTLGVLS